MISRVVNLQLSYNSPAVKPAMTLSTLKLRDKIVMVSDLFTCCFNYFWKVSDLFSHPLTTYSWIEPLSLQQRVKVQACHFKPYSEDPEGASASSEGSTDPDLNGRT